MCCCRMKLLLLGAVLAYMAEASCSLTCEKSSCTAQADAVQECLQNVPYNQVDVHITTSPAQHRVSFNVGAP